jgi:hypothetical protein
VKKIKFPILLSDLLSAHFSINVYEPACGGSALGVDDLDKRKTDAENVVDATVVLQVERANRSR